MVVGLLVGILIVQFAQIVFASKIAKILIDVIFERCSNKTY